MAFWYKFIVVHSDLELVKSPDHLIVSVDKTSQEKGLFSAVKTD